MIGLWNHGEAMAESRPKTVEEIFLNFYQRKLGIIGALVYNVPAFWDGCKQSCNDACLYGLPDGSWKVDALSLVVPPHFPNPTAGVNQIMNSMEMSEGLLVIAALSDGWLYSMVIYYAAGLSQKDRLDLLTRIGQLPTVYDLVAAKHPKKVMPADLPQIISTMRTRFQVYDSSSSGRASDSSGSGRERCVIRGDKDADGEAM